MLRRARWGCGWGSDEARLRSQRVVRSKARTGSTKLSISHASCARALSRCGSLSCCSSHTTVPTQRARRTEPSLPSCTIIDPSSRHTDMRAARGPAPSPWLVLRLSAAMQRSYPASSPSSSSRRAAATAPRPRAAPARRAMSRACSADAAACASSCAALEAASSFVTSCSSPSGPYRLTITFRDSTAGGSGTIIPCSSRSAMEAPPRRRSSSASCSSVAACARAAALSCEARCCVELTWRDVVTRVGMRYATHGVALWRYGAMARTVGRTALWRFGTHPFRLREQVDGEGALGAAGVGRRGRLGDAAAGPHRGGGAQRGVLGAGARGGAVARAAGEARGAAAVAVPTRAARTTGARQELVAARAPAGERRVGSEPLERREP